MTWGVFESLKVETQLLVGSSDRHAVGSLWLPELSAFHKVVVAKFYAPRIVFKIPDGIDLEDKTVVKKWWVRNGTLYINFVDGHNEEIDEEYSTGFEELDCVQETVIEDAEDWNVEYSQDEEEEEDD